MVGIPSDDRDALTSPGELAKRTVEDRSTNSITSSLRSNIAFDKENEPTVNPLSSFAGGLRNEEKHPVDKVDHEPDGGIDYFAEEGDNH